MVTENDPLAEEEGPCVRCEAGWVRVKPAYAVHLYPDLSAEQVAGLDAEQVAVAWEALAERRAAAEQSIYPCRRCQPALFYRWAGGHFRLGHDVLHCTECVELMGGKRAARRAAAHLPENLTPPPRKDIT